MPEARHRAPRGGQRPVMSAMRLQGPEDDIAVPLAGKSRVARAAKVRPAIR